MQERWSKRQQKELRKLQGLAWERELDDALRELRSDFETWEKGGISGFELSDRIHKFHSGRSRELYNMYSGSLDLFWIGHVIARGVINESELSDNLRDVLKEDVADCHKRLQATKQLQNSE